MLRFPFVPALLAAAIPLAVGIASCTAAPAKGLLIAVQTDLSVTKDFDKLGLYITVDGKPVFANEYPFDSGGKVRLPSSLAVLPSDNPNAVVRVRAVAFRKGEARVLRQAITTIPSNRAALLRMPLEWLSAGTSTSGSEGDYISNPFSKGLNLCPSDDQTSDKGLCITASFAVDTLPDYNPADVFGGGDESGNGGCFDVGACFASSVKLPLDLTDCTVPFTGSTAGLNVAVATTTGDGEPVAGETLVVQNQSAWTASNGRIHLPAALCQSPKKSEVKAIVVATACAPKTESFPICGPFSTGKPLPLLGDAGALPIVDGGDGGVLPPIEDFGSAEPDVSTVVVGPTYIYAVGSDPISDASGGFRLVYFDKTGAANQGPLGTFALSAPTVTRVSAAVALNAGNLVVAEALPDVSGGALDVFKLKAGVPSAAASYTASVANSVVALSSQSIFHAGIIGYSVARRPLSNPSLPDNINFGTIVEHSVVSMRLLDGATPTLFVGTQEGRLYRVENIEDLQLPTVVELLSPAATEGMAIGGIAVVPGGNELVLSMTPPTGPGRIALVASAFASDGGAPDGGMSLTVLAPALALTPSGDVHAARYRGVGADAKYAYFAANDGLRYIALDGSGNGKSTLLKPGLGVFGVDVDATHVYWTAMDDQVPTDIHRGIGRALLIP